MDEYVDEELQEAKDALTDAKILHGTQGTDKAVVNRLYYACFHAVNAVLHTKGFDPTTHQGTLRLFGKEVVTEGDATRMTDDFSTICDPIAKSRTTNIRRSMRMWTS